MIKLIKYRVNDDINAVYSPETLGIAYYNQNAVENIESFLMQKCRIFKRVDMNQDLGRSSTKMSNETAELVIDYFFRNSTPNTEREVVLYILFRQIF